MAKLTNQLLTIINQDRLLGLSLGLSLIFFIYKGVLYALIGSFVPLLVILIIIGLILFSLKKSPRALIRSIGLWSALIILWSTIRLLLTIVNLFVKPVPEGHIDGQLGPMSILLSVAFLFAGIYIWKNRKSIMPPKTCRLPGCSWFHFYD